MQIYTREICSHCEGKKVLPNLDEDTKQSIPFDNCYWCEGTGIEYKWISIDEIKTALGIKSE